MVEVQKLAEKVSSDYLEKAKESINKLVDSKNELYQNKKTIEENIEIVK